MSSVIVYSSDTCPWCDKVKAFLKENSVEFEERNVSENRDFAMEVQEKSGGLAIPVIDIDGTIIIGFNPKKIKEILGIQP
jgi:glutaredoxin-like YruB-family protein